MKPARDEEKNIIRGRGLALFSRLSLFSLLGLGIAFAPYEAALALSQMDRYCVNRYCPAYSNEKDACGSGAATGTVNLPASVPAPFNEIFSTAAARFKADPFIVAVVYYTENRGWRNPPPPYGTGPPWRTSPAGAQGPMQFLPSTWEGHKQDGNGDGKTDILDLKDAAHGAAQFLVAIGGKAGIPEGNPSNPRSVKPSVVDTLASYNSGPAGSGTSAETTQYIQIGLKIYRELKAGKPAEEAGGTTGGAGGGAAVCGDESTTGLGVSGDGFVFPLRTTKPKMTNNDYWSPRCKNRVSSMNGTPENPVRLQGLCHHDYLAADIQTAGGTQVVAVRPGRIIRASISPISQPNCFGSNMSLYSDKALGGDGLTYYYTHLASSHVAKDEQVVKAGDVISTVGNAPGSCFQSHLHIDASPSTKSFARNSRIGTAGPLLDIQPALIAAYQKLPEN